MNNIRYFLSQSTYMNNLSLADWTIETVANLSIANTSTTVVTSIGFTMTSDMDIIIGHSGNPLIETSYTRNLAGPNDISTIGGATGSLTYPNNSVPQGCYISNDGMTFCISTDDDFRVYDLVSPNVITGGVLNYATTIEPNKYSVWFSPDGLNAYMGRFTNMIQMTLSVPYDIRTATYTYTRALPGQSNYYGISMNSIGTQMVVSGQRAGSLRYISLYNLPTPWDISSITEVHSTFQTVGLGSCVVDRVNGQYIYLWDAFGSPDTLYQYSV